MGDQPTAEALLEAMALTLDRQVVPATSGGAQHATRVVANLCRIIGRELASEPPGGLESEVWRLLGRDDPPEDGPTMGQATELSTEAITALDDALRSADPELLDAALPLLRRDVERRLTISKPTYLDHRR